jgi:transposase
LLAVQPPRAARAADDADQFPPRDAPRRFRAQKKRPRASEIDRPDVAAKREAFLTWVRRQDPNRLVFVDEAGANLAMGRSHVWVQRGEEYVEARPMNWGDNLTLVGAIRRRGWVALSTKWRAMNRPAFVDWVRRRLAPRLRRGDIVLLDNLQAHRAPEVRFFIEQRGATLKPLPPYSHDFSPIEPAWGLVKRRIRDYAPRTGGALRRVARAARHVVTPHHCRQYFAHAGYGNSSTFRD